MSPMQNMLRLLSPGGEHGRLSILIFHRILARPDPLLPGEPDLMAFSARIRWLRDNMTVLPLSEAVSRLTDGHLPPRAVAITFDDGYADNALTALPVLNAYRVSATFFITTGYLNGGHMWNDVVMEAVRCASATSLDLRDFDLPVFSLATMQDRRTALDQLLGTLKYRSVTDRDRLSRAIALKAGLRHAPPAMMTDSDLRQLHRAGMSIGAHTVTHPILSTIDDASARVEITGSKAALEEALDAPVDLFAYPNGLPNRDYHLTHVEMVREAGFKAAVSTAWGSARSAADRFELPRFTPWDREVSRLGWRLAQNLFRQVEVCAQAQA